MVSCTGITGADGKLDQLIDGVVAEKSKATITISTSTAFDNKVLESGIWVTMRTGITYINIET
jgi:hypothetical protein